MGKADFLSPKAIANRIKSKGLQKLRWYCQMCQKQCRDEVGETVWFTIASWVCWSVLCFVSLWLFHVFLRSSTERLQMSLHVGVPSTAVAAGLGEPQQVHGLLLQVSSYSLFSSFLRDVTHTRVVPQTLICLLIMCFSLLQRVQEWLLGATSETLR